MAKPKINYAVDILMTISFILTAATGIIIFFFLPGGIRQGGHQEIGGVSRHSLADLHNWAGMLMIILILIHFILHWTWLISMTKNLFKKKPNIEQNN
ncbi:MAG: DUF4405 domain-containing protein [Patescibacteria group bacterium]